MQWDLPHKQGASVRFHSQSASQRGTRKCRPAGKSATHQQQASRAARAVEVKKEKIEDAEFANEQVEAVAMQQDGERYRFSLLERLVRQSIAEQRVILASELDAITKSRNRLTR